MKNDRNFIFLKNVSNFQSLLSREVLFAREILLIFLQKSINDETTLLTGNIRVIKLQYRPRTSPRFFEKSFANAQSQSSTASVLLTSHYVRTVRCQSRAQDIEK